MAVLLDHASAMMVGLALMMMLAVVQIRAQRMAAERTIMHIAKTQTLEFADALTREMSNMGASLPSDQRVDRLASLAEGRTDTLQFWRKNASAEELNIRYTLVPTDTVEVDGDAVPLFAVRRYSNDVQTGGSMSSLESFDIGLLDDHGQDVGSQLTKTRQVRVSFVNSIPLRRSDGWYLNRTYYGTTLKPRGLK